MATVTICSDSGAQEHKISHCFHFFPIYLPWSDRPRYHDLNFSNVEFQGSFCTLLFHPHQEALSALRAQEFPSGGLESLIIVRSLSTDMAGNAPFLTTNKAQSRSLLVQSHCPSLLPTTPSSNTFTLTLFLGVESIHRRFQERIWLFILFYFLLFFLGSGSLKPSPTSRQKGACSVSSCQIPCRWPWGRGGCWPERFWWPEIRETCGGRGGSQLRLSPGKQKAQSPAPNHLSPP